MPKDEIKKLTEIHGKQMCQIKHLKDALNEILLGIGAYSINRLTHAENTIENMKDIAKRALDDVR